MRALGQPVPEHAQQGGGESQWLELVGVEDRDHGDRSEVVDHRQRQQEGAQGHRQPATGHSQHRQRERDVRGHRIPSRRDHRRWLRVDRGVDGRGDDHAAQCGSHRHRRLRQLAQRTLTNSCAWLESGDEEEHREKSVGGPLVQTQVEVQRLRTDREIAELLIGVAPGEFARIRAISAAMMSSPPPTVSSRNWRRTQTRSVSGSCSNTSADCRCSLVVTVAEALTDQVHHGRVGQRRHITQASVFGHVAQEAAHDLARTGLRQFGDQHDLARFGDGTDLLGDVLAQLGNRIVPGLHVAAQDDERHDAWPVISSVAPTTAASATSGCKTSADSTSVVEIR